MILDKSLSDKEKAEKLCQEMDGLIAERKPFETDWTLAQTLVSSVQLKMTQDAHDKARGYDLPSRITDKPSFYEDTLVSGLCGYAVNSNIKWMKLGIQNKKLSQGYGVKDWFEDVEEQLYDEFDNNNFYPQIKMVIEQASGVFGYGIMLIDENLVENKPRFKHISSPECYLDVNEQDEYDTVFRVYYMTLEDAVARFGIDEMAETVQANWRRDSANKGGEHTELKLLHAVFRRKDANGKSARNVDMPWASFYVDVDNQHIIEESGYRSFPYAIFVWDREGGLKYPISAGVKAINSINLLHEQISTQLKVAEMAAHPPVAIPETMKKASEIFGADGYIAPGAPLYYETGDAVPAALNMGANFPITLEITKDQAEDVKQWFYVDFFLALMSQNDMKNVTATAVQALQGEKTAVMSNMIDNLKNALYTAIMRTFDIKSREGKMPDMPAALLNGPGERGNRLAFIFDSVLSQLQKAYLRFQGAAQFLPYAQAVATLGAAYPPAMSALDRFDFDQLLQSEARAANLSETVIREDQDVAEMQRQRAQAAAAAQIQQQQAQAAQTYQNMNEPVQEGSPAAAALGAA